MRWEMSPTCWGTIQQSVNFSIASGGSGSITINAAATGVVLSLLNTLEVVIQRFDTALNARVTVVDTGKPDFASLLTLGASGVTLNYSGLTGGDYRVVSYNTNLLATGAYTSLDVSVVKPAQGPSPVVLPSLAISSPIPIPPMGRITPPFRHAGHHHH